MCDGQALIGGRNLGDYNFQLKNPRYDYTLRVVGPLVREFHTTFNAFWTDERSALQISHQKRTWNKPEEVTQLEETLYGLDYNPNMIFETNDLRFVSDSPQQTDRYVADSIKEELSLAREEVIIETQNFFLSAEEDGIFKSTISQSKVPYKIYTASGTSHGSAGLAMGWYGGQLTLDDITSNRIKGYRLKNDWNSANKAELHPIYPNLKKDSMGYHNQLVIVDKKNIFFTSFNFDALSELHNIEMGLWVYDVPQLAKHIIKMIEKRGVSEKWDGSNTSPGSLEQ